MAMCKYLLLLPKRTCSTLGFFIIHSYFIIITDVNFHSPLFSPSDSIECECSVLLSCLKQILASFYTITTCARQFCHTHTLAHAHERLKCHFPFELNDFNLSHEFGLFWTF